MSSLPWICAVTLTLLCCLTAQPVERSSYVSEMIEDFDKTIENDKCWKDKENTTFYSPVDVKKTCVYSALGCYVKKLEVLVEECGAQEAVDDLMMTLKGLKTPVPSCSNYICEVSPQKPFKEFFDNMKSLVEQIKSLP